MLLGSSASSQATGGDPGVYKIGCFEANPVLWKHRQHKLMILNQQTNSLLYHDGSGPHLSIYTITSCTSNT